MGRPLGVSERQAPARRVPVPFPRVIRPGRALGGRRAANTRFQPNAGSSFTGRGSFSEMDAAARGKRYSLPRGVANLGSGACVAAD